MWTAIRSDLMDFVTTIAEDTTKTINKVIGEKAEEDEEVSLREQMTTDLRRSYSTYGTIIEEQYSTQYEKFLKKFSLSSQASDIAELLDAEVDVSRYYAELVPSQIKPEEFWARYFFRLLLLSKEGSINLDEEDDEELLWETHDNEKGDKEEGKAAGLSPIARKDTNDSEEGKSKLLRDKITALEAENLRLKGQVKTLAVRVSELEKEILRRDQIPSPSPFNQTLAAKVSPTTPIDESKASSRPVAQSAPHFVGRATEGSAVDSINSNVTAASNTERSARRAIAQELLVAPSSSSNSPLAPADSASSSFKPIPASGSTVNTHMGTTRLSLVSSSLTTLATESSINTGSVSPLTEVTEAFIRRAQKASLSASALTNINSSANASISSSEHGQSASYQNNNDLHSETASEDSGVMVVPEKATSTAGSAKKGSEECAGMEMSSMNLISSFDKAVVEPLNRPIAPPATGPVAKDKAEEVVGKLPAKVAAAPGELAALDDDDDENDGWS